MQIRRIATGTIVPLFLVTASCAHDRTQVAPTPAAAPGSLYARGATPEQTRDDPLLRDARVVQELTNLCDARMAEARVAQAAAKRSGVRDFATRVLEENRGLCVRLTALWRELGLIQLRDTREVLNAGGYRLRALELSSRKGTFIDRAFLETVVDDDVSSLTTIDRLLAEAAHPELRSFIRSEFLPVSHSNRVLAKRMLASAQQLGEDRAWESTAVAEAPRG